MRVRYVDQLVIVFEIEVMVRRDVGIEIGLGSIDADLTQQAGVGQLVKRVVDRGERDRDLGQRRLLIEHFRSQMACTLAKKKPAQCHSLARRTKACGLQHFIDVVPRATGQSRLVSRIPACDTGAIVLQNRSLVAHFHVRHRAYTFTGISPEIYGKSPSDASFSQVEAYQGQRIRAILGVYGALLAAGPYDRERADLALPGVARLRLPRDAPEQRCRASSGQLARVLTERVHCFKNARS